ncbi:MAG: endonuclease/exonuclease/phosphatase family protein [Chromatiaceae bacterium]|nr:endonuclease/exonuclease/phosphatase family protein [Gammaproteobacteria bacterium]MCB1871815.1 endonuclease/exonuclease/phosphatase family protein [Gammaproteobacteria bacterium]MCB1878626.1 endonuclease/exonuclease/phosphatase family protein [Gammaproteobacteria bacterium]MCP5427559.1 endonuclease/exonuclease/phosphatase family protein [Chromatiaceae bacterium]MCP5447604.1 endonuclease/exonuclease/phosphatase family protein [Chromatiaceae bacterium]
MSAVEQDDYQRLRLLSYNIQTGVDTSKYRHYLTQGWKHVLPHRERQLNLDRIASMIKPYDIVGLQEVDSGSLRTGFVDQTEYLAHCAQFPFWFEQINRKIGKLAQHSNGLLCRVKPTSVNEYKLPGLPGRGVIVSNFGGENGLSICIMHLALGRRARLRQIQFVSELISSQRHAVVMGDMNCSCESDELQLLEKNTNLRQSGCRSGTFPSWRPMRRIDHILVSDSLLVENARVLDYPMSDHLPIGIDILIPKELELAA